MVEECEITKLLAAIDPKTKEKKKVGRVQGRAWLPYELLESFSLLNHTNFMHATFALMRTAMFCIPCHL